MAGGAPGKLDLLVDDSGGVVVNAVHAGVGAEAAAAARRRRAPRPATAASTW